MLQKGVRHHREQRVMLESCPAAPLEMVEPQFLFQLLVRVVATPVLCAAPSGTRRVPAVGARTPQDSESP